jgi:hypothetical protein
MFAFPPLTSIESNDRTRALGRFLYLYHESCKACPTLRTADSRVNQCAAAVATNLFKYLYFPISGVAWCEIGVPH